MSQITDEMVNAAIRAYLDTNPCGQVTVLAMRAALEATANARIESAPPARPVPSATTPDFSAIVAAALLREVLRRTPGMKVFGRTSKALQAMANAINPHVRLRADGTAFLLGDDLGVTF
jgi:hypothetical protein